MHLFNRNNKIFIIAELPANHNHNLGAAIKTIQAAKKAEVDAIKLQTYTSDTMLIALMNIFLLNRVHFGIVEL